MRSLILAHPSSRRPLPALAAPGVFIGSSIAALADRADIPAGVETAITGAGTDTTTLGGDVLIVIVGIFAFFLLRKVLR